MLRLVPGVLCFTAALFFTVPHPSAARQNAQPPAANPVDPEMPFFLTCAKDCDDCARSCELSAAQCLTHLADGLKDLLPTLRTCQDCAAICSAASRVIAKDGPLGEVIAPSCQEACKRCAVL